MPNDFFKIISNLLILIIIFTPTYSFSQPQQTKFKGPVAVTHINDNVSDNLSKDLSDAFAKSLTTQGIRVIEKEKVEAVIAYYQREGETPQIANPADEAEQSLIQAREHYYNFAYNEAVAQIKRAISILESSQQLLYRHGRLLRDTYITAAIIEISGGSPELATEYFRKVLNMDPHYELDEKAFPPSVVSVFTSLRAEISSRPVGSIMVGTNPGVAEVYLNGVLKGVTPLTIPALPIGSYFVLINTNKYQPVQEQVTVTENGTTKIIKKLVWAGEPSKQPVAALSQRDEAREQVTEGLRIAELLRVPKVIIIDVDEEKGGEGQIAIRMVDRAYKAGHNPVVLKYSSDKRDLASNLAKATNIVVGQMRVSLAENPQKYVEPLGFGEPTLLGKRKKALWALPAFWAVVGGVLAATAGGATAAALSGGAPKSETGSVNVRFK